MGGRRGEGAPSEDGFFDERAVDSVLRAAALVEARMGEPIGVGDMADAACYSPFYFSRLFSRATGHAPYDYLMRRRVAASAEEVVSGSRSLTDIALDYGFEVPDSFARAFRRCFGLSPSEARRAGAFSRSIARTLVSRPYVEAMLSGGALLPEPLEAEGEILSGAWAFGSGAVSSALASFGGARGSGTIVFERDGDLLPTRAFIGGRSGSASPPPYPLSATAVPGGSIARFEIRGGADSLAFVLEFAYRAWLPSTGRPSAPHFDLVEAKEGGKLFLILPLAGGNFPCTHAGGAL